MASRRRAGRRAGFGVAAFLAFFMVVVPVGAAYIFTHTSRAEVPADRLGVAHEDVSFTTSDGLELEGWYMPSRNGAVVIAFPGRNGPQKPARMLARHGYGVLLFDRRGEGRSEGRPNALGWGGDRDIEAAIAYLRTRADVDPDRIAGLGLSVGGELMLEAAATGTGLRAVVSEGAGARVFSEEIDQELSGVDHWSNTVPAFVKQASMAVFSDTRPPADLEDLVGRIAPRPALLIAAPNSKHGEDLNRRYHAAGPSTELWEIPESDARRRADRAARPSTSAASWASSTGRCGREPPALGGGAGLHGRHRPPRCSTRSTTPSGTAAPGLGLGQHALAGGASRSPPGWPPSPCSRGLRPGPRAALAFAFGALGAVNGGMHLSHVAGHGAAGSDVTGVLAAAAAARARSASRR